MLKHIYKFLGLMVIFVIAIIIFGQNIKVVKVSDNNEVVEVAGETFPVMTIISQDCEMNRLYGYSGNMVAGTVRESITPVNEDKSVSVLIDERNTVINKLYYEVRLVSSNELMTSGEVSAFDEDKEGKKTAKLVFDVNLLPSTEYTLKMTLVTEVSKKISYYTRLKFYSEDSKLDKKIEFVKNIHKMTIEKDESLSTYIEPDHAKDNTSLAYVDINSSFDNITWGDITPVEITKVVPTIMEYNMETAAVSLVYYARAELPSGLETFYVTEYYRVKCAEGRMYLLWFERNIQAQYDVLHTSVKKSQLKVGIGQEDEMQVVSNNAGTRVAFVRNGALYLYDLMNNSVNRIYTQFINDDEYEYNLYRQQDVRIISMDEEGNMYYAVYGYMSHGAYEGKVAIVLYEYNQSDNVIKEVLYIPFEMTYQMMRQEFEDYCYINSAGVFFFAINNGMYSYNTITEKLSCIAEGLSKDEYMIIPESHSFAWENDDESGLAKSISVLDMDTGITISVNTKDKEYLRLIGVIGTNVVYGIGREKDISATSDGTPVYALSKVEIIDKNGGIVKSYKKKGYYVVNAYVDNNVVYLERCKKRGKEYVKASKDNIINRQPVVNKTVKLVSRVTKKALTEWYIALPPSYKMEKTPEYVETNNYLVTEAHPIYLDNNSVYRYYVYAKGGIKASYESPAEAIVQADNEQGVVIDSNNQLVWERGGRYNTHIISGINNIRAEGDINSMEACAIMLLDSIHASADIKDIKGKDMSIMEILAKYTDTGVNLTGCSFDEILYYVSGDRPVIALKDSSHAVIITAYTANSVTIYDPVAGASSVMLHSSADAMFRAAGNIFVSAAK